MTRVSQDELPHISNVGTRGLELSASSGQSGVDLDEMQYHEPKVQGRMASNKQKAPHGDAMLPGRLPQTLT